MKPWTGDSCGPSRGRLGALFGLSWASFWGVLMMMMIMMMNVVIAAMMRMLVVVVTFR